MTTTRLTVPPGEARIVHEDKMKLTLRSGRLQLFGMTMLKGFTYQTDSSVLVNNLTDIAAELEVNVPAELIVRPVSYLAVASDLLRRPRLQNVLITGRPKSGKTTLVSLFVVLMWSSVH